MSDVCTHTTPSRRRNPVYCMSCDIANRNPPLRDGDPFFPRLLVETNDTIVANWALSDDERHAMEKRLATRHGITLPD